MLPFALSSRGHKTHRCNQSTNAKGGDTQPGTVVALTCSVLADVGTQKPIELHLGELRGSITIPCPPGDSWGGTRRLWCRVGRSRCILIADTDGYVGKSYEGRICITPQESSGAFKVLINDLRLDDAGLYKCGMGSPADWDSWQLVALQVTTGRRGFWGLLCPIGSLQLHQT